jgi:cytochrome c biogenesis protein CcmG, thiol:disulfide interchange protein DsbE
MAARVKLVFQAAAVAVVALLVVLLAWRVLEKEEGRGIADSIADGERPAAPALELPLLVREGTFSLDSLRGKAVVVNFWASWCEPCKSEAPLLEQAWQRYRDEGLVVVGVDAQDFTKDAKGFAERYEITYPTVHDGAGSTLGRWGVVGFPETFFVGRDGRLVGEKVSGELDAEQLESNIRVALES